jgi:PKD repeat protein
MLKNVSVVCALRKFAQASTWVLLPTAVVLVAIVSVCAPDPAAAALTASFDFTPASPLTKEKVTFTSTSAGDQPLVSELWDLDDDGKFDDASGNSAEYSFAKAGNHAVRLQVTDVPGTTAVVSQIVPVRNRPPTASFDYSPASPETNEAVTFKSTSVDPDGSVKSQAWDLDNDGQFDDGTQVTAQRSFKSPGSYQVSLRVVDNQGGVAVDSRLVSVGNRPPTATFAYVPASPLPGQLVTFFSTASDPDGPLSAQSWDLDNDGQFDDGTGPSVNRSFDAPGTYTVGLQVTDTEGLSTTGFETVVVHAPSSTAALDLRLLSPFPIVRIAGTVTRHGAKLRRFAVTAPSGASIVVRCRGHSCPFHRYGPKAAAWAARLVRIRRFEGRLLRTGTRLEIFIRQPGTIGKYTRFRIRSGKSPARLDRCLLSDSRRPVRCPT